MRKLTYYVASTLDGFIAHQDGSLNGFSWGEEFGSYLIRNFPETIPVHLQTFEHTRADNKQFDTVLMGRKTYEVGVQEGITNPYPTLDQHVFSRSLQESPDEAVELVSEKAIETVNKLKQKPGKAIWLCGGSGLATTLLNRKLINALIIKLNPVLFGTGIPLFHSNIDQTDLKLKESTGFDSGHLLLHYEVT